MALARSDSRGDVTIAGRLKSGTADTTQVRRLVSNTPRAKAVGGGIVGVSRAEALDLQETNSPFPSGSSNTSAGWICTDLWDTEGAGIAQDPSDEQRVVVAEEGWYSVNGSWRLGWPEATTAPNVFTLSGDYEDRPGDSGFYYPAKKVAPIFTGSGHTVMEWLPWGPFHLPAGGWIWLGANWDNEGPSTGGYAHMDITRWTGPQ